MTWLGRWVSSWLVNWIGLSDAVLEGVVSAEFACEVVRILEHRQKITVNVAAEIIESIGVAEKIRVAFQQQLISLLVQQQSIETQISEEEI